MPIKSCLIIGSDGSEEMELVIPSDLLRRADIQVTIAGLQDQPTIVCARKTSIQVDQLFKEVMDTTFDAVLLPGGQQGSQYLAEDERVGKLLRHHEKQHKILAAICAGPLAFVKHHIAKGGQLTSYPSIRDKIVSAGYQYSEANVCVWENTVTSRGPGTAFEFALTLITLLVDKQKAEKVAQALLLASR